MGSIHGCSRLRRPEAFSGPAQSIVGGHQVLGFDQLTPIYHNYVVLGAKMTCNFASAAADLGSGVNMCGIYLNDDQSGSGQYDSIIEQGNAVYKILSGNQALGQCKLSKNFSTKRYFGLTDVKDDPDLRGTGAANPVKDAYFVVFAQGLASGSDPTTVYVNIVIEYITMWTDRKHLTQS